MTVTASSSGLRPPGPGVVALQRVRSEPLAFVTELARTYGDVTRHVVDGEEVVMVHRPDLVRQVLKDNGNAYSKRNTPDEHMLRPLLGNGLLTSSGAEWAQQRRTAAPAFRPSQVRRFDTVITDATSSLISRWSAAADAGAVVSADHQLTSMTLAVVVRAILGLEVDGIGDGFGHAVDSVNAWIGHVGTEPPANRASLMTFAHAKGFLDLVADTLLAARRSSGSRERDLLSTMISHGYIGSEVDLREQVLTLIMAGHETTAKALTWTLYLLDTHPSRRQQVEDEVDRVLGGAVPRAEDLADLPGCRQVVQEAMRLYPPIWLISRRALEADVLDGFSVLPGDLVCMSQWVLHRDPRYWTEPETFAPERFAGGSAPVPSHCYLPFGGGDRVCIGQHLAILEATLALAMIVQRLQLSVVPGTTVRPQALVTLRPENGMPMYVSRRSSVP